MDIQRAKQLLWDKDETQGYVEREMAIDAFLAAGGGSPAPGRALCFRPGSGAGRPVHAHRTGRACAGAHGGRSLALRAGAVPAGGKSHIHNPFQVNGRNTGHMSLDYAPLLQKGLRGLLRELQQNAVCPAQQRYAQLMGRAVEATAAIAAVTPRRRRQRTAKRR